MNTSLVSKHLNPCFFTLNFQRLPQACNITTFARGQDLFLGNQQSGCCQALALQQKCTWGWPVNIWIRVYLHSTILYHFLTFPEYCTTSNFHKHETSKLSWEVAICFMPQNIQTTIQKIKIISVNNIFNMLLFMHVLAAKESGLQHHSWHETYRFDTYYHTHTQKAVRMKNWQHHLSNSLAQYINLSGTFAFYSKFFNEWTMLLCKVEARVYTQILVYINVQKRKMCGEMIFNLSTTVQKIR